MFVRRYGSTSVLLLLLCYQLLVCFLYAGTVITQKPICYAELLKGMLDPEHFNVWIHCDPTPSQGVTSCPSILPLC